MSIVGNAWTRIKQVVYGVYLVAKLHHLNYCPLHEKPYTPGLASGVIKCPDCREASVAVQSYLNQLDDQEREREAKRVIAKLKELNYVGCRKD